MEKKKTRIFPAKTKGFTLIEIMIVLAIMVILFSIGAPKLLKNIGSPIKQTTRQLVMLTKQLHSNAKIRNRTYRIVIEFPPPQGNENRNGKFYVESAASSQLLESEEELKKKRGTTKEHEKGVFAPDPIVKKPIEFPNGLKVTSVEKENLDRPITEGKAYIHFFPQGIIERSIIHLVDAKDRELSLVINPLTGRTDVEPSNISMKELTR